MALNYLKQTRHKLYELEDQSADVSYSTETDRQESFYNRDVKNTDRLQTSRHDFASSIKATPMSAPAVDETKKAIQRHIEDSQLAILDVEIDQALADLELLSTFAPEECRKEVARLRVILQDIIARLPEHAEEGSVSPKQRARVQECKEFHDRLLHYELQLTRDGTKIELDGLKMELQQLEEEEIVSKAVEKETTDKELNVLYDLIQNVNDNVETVDDLTHQDRAGSDLVKTDSSPSVIEAIPLASELAATGGGALKNVQDALSLLDNNISAMSYGEHSGTEVGTKEDGFKQFQQTVSQFSAKSGIPFCYVPAGRYTLGVPETKNLNMLAALELIENKTQWEILSEQQKEDAVGLSSIGVRPKIPDGSTFMSYIPSTKVDLGGYFISMYPIRITDWQQIMKVPEWHEKLSKIVSPTLADGYKYNYCPHYLSGQMFGFSKHTKDALDDTDAPSLELPYWTAKAVASILGCRIPTWQEWEAAVRGSESFMYPWGDTLQLDAVQLENPLPVWSLKLKRLLVHDAYLDADANTRLYHGKSVRVNSFGVYDYAQSPFGLRRLIRFGYEWNTANFDLTYPAGPTTHLVRTLADFHTQYILEGGDQTGNHRSFTGPIAPMFARPYSTVRNAAFRLVIAPSHAGDDAGFTNRMMQSVLALGSTSDDAMDLESKKTLLKPRTCGAGGGILRGSPNKLGYGVGASLSNNQLAFQSLLLLFGMGEERVLVALGEPENRDNITPVLLERAIHWKYHSLGVMICFDATFKRKVVKEIHLWDSTAEDLLAEDWARYVGLIDSNGLSFNGGLSLHELEQQWGPCHNQWSNIVYYLREYLEFCPDSKDPTSLITNTRRRHASSSLAFEFHLRIDRTVMKMSIKLG